MAEKPIIDIPVIGIAVVAVAEGGAGEVIIGMETAWKADVRLKLNPQTLADLEALLARVSAEQAKHGPIQ